MTGKAPPPANAVSVSAAAALLGLTADRIGQLVRGGHAVSPGRGWVNLPSLLRGYAATLRAAGARPASAALARDQMAKAELIADATADRRAELIELADAEATIEAIAKAAVDQIRLFARPGAAVLKGLAPKLAADVREEAKAAIARVEQAQATAIAALRSGNFEEIDA